MRFWSVLLLFLSVCGLFSSCTPDDEELNNSPSVRLEFDQDTVHFDTVFTSIGSVSKRLWVYNRDRHAVNISRIELAQASGLQYKLTINGQKTNSVTDIKLRGEDSLLVLVTVEIDPSSESLPFIVSDSIRFTTNGNLQDVDLVAYGQDAYFHYYSYDQENIGSPAGCPTEIWKADKPHVIYGYVGIPQGCTLAVEAGARLYFHAGSGLFIGGQLIVDGYPDKRVTMQGDRLEERYQNRPGQWLGIIFTNNLIAQSHIQYADIKNAVYGVLMNSPDSDDLYDLILEQCDIRNMIANGLFALSSDVQAYNCVFTNTGEAAVGLFGGGTYDLVHCTIANFGGFFLHDQPSARFEARTELATGGIAESPLNLRVLNSIIYGSLRDELAFITTQNSAVDFRNNILRTEEYASVFPADANNRIRQVVNYPRFNSPAQGDLLPDSSSASTVAFGIPNLVGLDLRGKDRPAPGDTIPDVGAYEVDQP